MTTAYEKMRERHAQHAMMMRSPKQQDEAIIRHYAATAALAIQGVKMVDAKRAGYSDDAVDANIAHIASLLNKAHQNDFGVSLPCVDQASAAQYSARIKELEQQNERLQDKVAVLTDSLCKIKWHRKPGGSPTKYEYEIECIAHDALSATTQTAEAYKRRIQVGAWQPIETAPKDGFHILLYKPEITYVGFWAVAGWCANSTGCPTITDPTHWMPLPPSPELKGE